VDTNTVVDFLVRCLIIFGWSIFVPFVFVKIGIEVTPLVIIPIILGWWASYYFYGRMKHKRWSPLYKEWKKTASEMGLNKIDHTTIIGNYRNHNVTIDEIDVGTEGEEGWQTVLKTRYRVDFENPRMILLYIKKSFSLRGYFSWSWAPPLSKKYIRDIHLDNPQLLEGLVMKGNNENAIKSILDSSICNRIMNIKDTLYEMEIGYGKYLRPRSWRDHPEMQMEPNEVRYIDSRSLSKTKRNALKFKSIVDTLIDIVEKVETYTPSI